MNRFINITGGADGRQKLYTALASIGWPMLQSGASTALSTACLCLVPSYMAWVFFKTVLLVVVLGTAHGLVVLPTLLAWLPLELDDARGLPRPRRHKHQPPDLVCDIHIPPK